MPRPMPPLLPQSLSPSGDHGAHGNHQRARQRGPTCPSAVPDCSAPPPRHHETPQPHEVPPHPHRAPRSPGPRSGKQEEERATFQRQEAPEETLTCEVKEEKKAYMCNTCTGCVYCIHTINSDPTTHDGEDVSLF